MLDSLLNLIITSVNVMKAQLAAADLPEPSLAACESHEWDKNIPPVEYWNARKELLSALGMMKVSLLF